MCLLTHGEGAIAIEIESIKEKMRGGLLPLYLTDSFKPSLAREGTGRFPTALSISIRFFY